MDKRGDGNTFWIIIVMVLALIALVVLAVIFTKGATKGNQGFFDCQSKGGVCNVDKSQECGQGFTENAVFNCEDKTKKCCIGAKG